MKREIAVERLGKEERLMKVVGRLLVVQRLAELCMYRIIYPIQHRLDVRREALQEAKRLAKLVLEALEEIEKIRFGEGDKHG